MKGSRNLQAYKVAYTTLKLLADKSCEGIGAMSLSVCYAGWSGKMQISPRQRRLTRAGERTSERQLRV